MTEIVTDLHSPEFSLMILCPNGVHKINNNMDKYIPNPRSSSPLAIQMLEFVGKLMGISLRTKATLPFNFPSFVWKGVLGQPLNATDLEGTDAYLVQSLNALTDAKMTAIDFDLVYGGEVTFTTTSSNGDTVDLLPGGERVAVTYERRHEYVDLVYAYRLHELDRQVAAMRRGLGCVVPLRLLQLFTWQQAEELVAGKPDVDLEDLKRHTEYRGFRPTDPAIVYFWRAMESLNMDERSQFIRFVWGRSRLPLKGRPWPQTFKIQRQGGVGDETLPVTHTCFFSIELPDYSTEEILKTRLLTAITYGVGGILNG